MTVSSDMYDLFAAAGSIFISHIYTIRMIQFSFFSFITYTVNSSLHSIKRESIPSRYYEEPQSY